jgi:Fe-S cluster assembly scaffold protein SufB
LAIGGGISNLCPECDQKRGEMEDPFFGLKRLTEGEAERWARLDAEIRNALQGKTILELEKDIANYKEVERRKLVVIKEQELRQQFDIEQKNKDIKITILDKQTQDLREVYVRLIQSFEEKYNVNRNKMVIDPDTRVIRELED